MTEQHPELPLRAELTAPAEVKPESSYATAPSFPHEVTGGSIAAQPVSVIVIVSVPDADAVANHMLASDGGVPLEISVISENVSDCVSVTAGGRALQKQPLGNPSLSETTIKSPLDTGLENIIVKLVPVPPPDACCNKLGAAFAVCSDTTPTIVAKPRTRIAVTISTPKRVRLDNLESV